MIAVRALLAIVIVAPVSVLFTHAWHEASAITTTTRLETDGIAFLRALQPVLTTLTEDESLAVSGEPVDPSVIDANLQAATNADKLYGTELQTHTRWQDFVASVTHLQTPGTIPPITAFNSYSSVSGLLLDVYERIRDRSGLVHDAEPDVFFLEDAAIRALPTSVVDAGRYGDSLIAEFSPGTGGKAAALNAATYRALLDRDADEVGDDVSDAVDATLSRSLSVSLLADIDLYRRSIGALPPLTVSRAQVTSVTGVPLAQATEESTAASLSGDLFDAIGALVTARGRVARRQEWSDLLSLLGALLLVFALIVIEIRQWRRSRSARPARDPAGGAHQRPPEHAPAGFAIREHSGVS